MVPIASASFRAAPRFRLVDNAPRSPAAPGLATQLGRALRVLARQRGGTMLLHACSSGATVRMECAFAGSGASVALCTSDERTAADLRAASDALVRDAARFGIVVLALSCSGPASQPLLPAA